MTREEQILEHLPQVRLIANSILRRLPHNAVPFDDLMSSGTIGLIHAVDHYQSERGLTLKTYAEYRIRGAIADSLRKLDPQSRQSRRFQKRLAAIADELEQKIERAPDDAELAGALGLEIAAFHRRRAEAAVAVLPLEHLRDEDGKPYAPSTPASDPDPEQSALAGERAERVRALVAQLPAAQARVLQLYYWGEMRQAAIARRYRVSPGRVSQLQRAALEGLRRRLAA